MKIHGINKLTLLDYPGKLACLLFTGHCNYRCPFCHNASLVLCPDTQPVISDPEIFDFLKKRRGVLEGVCISGGEPTLHQGLEEFIKKIRELGFAVKLDTNGTNPDVLYRLLEQGLLDMTAMDIKNSPEKYALTCGLAHIDLEPVKESTALLMKSSTAYEFRTTLVQEFHSLSDMEAIGQWLHGASHYYLQSFKDSGDLIGHDLHACSKEDLLHFLDVAHPHFQHVSLRGTE